MAHPACAKKLTERVNFGMALDGIPENLAPLAHDSTRKWGKKLSFYRSKCILNLG